MVSEIVDDLYIGDIDDARNHASEFDTIVSCCPIKSGAPFDPDHEFDMEDGSNEQSLFDAAVEVVRDELESDGRTLVHCAVGQSRSPAVVITAIAARNDLSWQAARDIVFRQRPMIAPHPELIEHSKTYLGVDESAYKNPF